ncbi:hypothetical protein RBSH_03063 [Rhodopirellula baltica SH28]|uniref:Uncharacterized protein n=2 Tax=Rhodopirellula TaxID=265488 RepID=M5SMT7_9BACT|nr:hypothetical protein RBSH_03063 [Rhodopirellula baltica SH28]EMI27569.1 hypothetical protein RESH_01971 [Rhodopirellula europaea SH398]
MTLLNARSSDPHELKAVTCPRHRDLESRMICPWFNSAPLN